MNLLFWFLFIPIALLALWHIHHYRRALETPPQSWPEWALEVGGDDLREHWTLHDLSIMASDDRLSAAVILDTTESDPERRYRLMRDLAHQIYDRAEIHAVFIRAKTSSPAPDLLLFAPDGRGWHGDDSLSMAFASSDLTPSAPSPDDPTPQ